MTKRQKEIINFLKEEGGKVRMNDLRLMSYSARSLNTLRRKGEVLDFICPETDKAYFKLEAE